MFGLDEWIAGVSDEGSILIQPCESVYGID